MFAKRDEMCEFGGAETDAPQQAETARGETVEIQEKDVQSVAFLTGGLF